MTKVITAPKKFDCEDKLGFFGDEKDYELLVVYVTKITTILMLVLQILQSI